MNFLNNNIGSNCSFFIEDFYINDHPKTFTMLSHYHDCLEINFIAQGSCAYYVGNKKHELTKNNLIIIDSSISHKLIFTPDVQSKVIGISLLKKEPQNNAIVPIENVIRNNSDLLSFFETFNESAIIHDARSIAGLLKQIIDECQDKNDCVFLNILVSNLLIDVSRLALANQPYILSHINKIKDYISLNYSTITCIDDISSHVGLNKNYLQRIFKDNVNCTVWQFLTRIRMHQASFLLLNSTMNIGDIDEKIGINSRQNFYILFKKHFGVSPNEYRKKLKK